MPPAIYASPYHPSHSGDDLRVVRNPTLDAQARWARSNGLISSPGELLHLSRENAVLASARAAGSAVYVLGSTLDTATGTMTTGELGVARTPEDLQRLLAQGTHAAGPSELLRDNSLLKEASDARVYFMQKGKKWHVPNPEVFNALGLAWGQIRVVPDGSLASVPVDDRGPPVKESTDARVFLIRADGSKWHIPDPAAFAALGFGPGDVRTVPPGKLAPLPNAAA